jgi:hypothetical protein
LLNAITENVMQMNTDIVIRHVSVDINKSSSGIVVGGTKRLPLMPKLAINPKNTNLEGCYA